MFDWYNLSWNEVVKTLYSDANSGLSEDRVIENREKYGDNNTINIKAKNSIFLFLKEILRIYSCVGFIVGALTIYNKEKISGCIILGITFVSVILSFTRSFISEKTLKELEKITPKSALALRDGKSNEIRAEDIVVGDILYIERGDIVPADLRIIECENLRIKESAVTGDNDIVEKYSTKIEEKELGLSEIKNMVFKSSFVIDGNAKCIVTSIGEGTEIGKITESFIKEKNDINIFEKNILGIIDISTIVFCLVAILILGYGVLKNQLVFSLKLIPTIYLTLVPLHIIFIIFYIGFVLRKVMKKRGVEFKSLSCIQKLSTTNLILINKIGSLTENRVYVNKIFVNGKIIDENLVEEDCKDNLNRILNIGLSCNEFVKNIEGDIIKGDLVEQALVRYGNNKNMDKKSLDIEMERIFLIPYDREKKMKTSVNRVDNKYRANIRGNVDALLKKCTHIMKNGIEVEITSKDIEDVRRADLKLSQEYLYIEGFAYRNFHYEPSINENIESNLVFVGLIGFKNPVKEDTDKYIEYARNMAVKPIIMTEDNKITAEAFGKKVGLLNKNDIVLSEVEMNYMDEKELENYIEKVGVFSKISYKTKNKISALFQKIGYNLAATGSRFTDCPSFRVAHIGIVTGKKCTNIAKKLSDLYVEDNDLMNHLTLIQSSRKIMQSLKNIIIYVLTLSIIETIISIVPVVFGYGIVIKNYEILFLNFIIVVISSLFIFSQYNSIYIKNYEGVVIDKKIFGEISNTVILGGIFLGIISLTSFFYGNNSLELKEKNLLISLNLACMFFSTYFLEFKKVFKNKISIIIFLVLVFFMILISFFYRDLYLNNYCNLKLMISFSICQFIVLLFMKKLK